MRRKTRSSSVAQCSTTQTVGRPRASSVATGVAASAGTPSRTSSPARHVRLPAHGRRQRRARARRPDALPVVLRGRSRSPPNSSCAPSRHPLPRSSRGTPTCCCSVGRTATDSTEDPGTIGTGALPPAGPPALCPGAGRPGARSPSGATNSAAARRRGAAIPCLLQSGKQAEHHHLTLTSEHVTAAGGCQDSGRHTAR